MSNIEQVNISALKGYARNSRTHSLKQLEQIAASIKEFGFTNPLLIQDDNTIIAGHGRFEAAKIIGLETVPCIKLSHLTPTQAKAYVIADNALAESAGWDKDLLQLELLALQQADFDLQILGIKDIDKLLDSGLGNTPEPGSSKEGAETTTCPKCGYEYAK